MGAAAVSGFLVGLSLILAIGAQAAFVLRQGLRREHVGAVVLTCSLSDAILMPAGVMGFGAMSQSLPQLDSVMRFGGAGFLVVYGALRFRAALQGGAALVLAASAPASLGRVLGTCLVLTWANPHVYLDALVLIGAISAQYAPHSAAFGVGAVCASFVFFISLGYGARLLTPIFATPRAWVMLEVMMGGLMWVIATGLLMEA